MRALVTGAAGFVGRHMAAELRTRGWEVDGFDIKLGRDTPRDFLYGDVRRLLHPSDSLWHITKGTYDLVVHCAYQVGGRATIDGQPMALAHNLAADAALFEWALTTGQRRVLYFSSSAAYPVRLQTREHIAYLERSNGLADEGFRTRLADRLRLAEHHINLTQWAKTGDWSPDAHYGWAKLTGEMLARAAAAEGLAVHVVRPFSGYGGDQGEEYPFPALLRKVLTSDGKPVKIWGAIDQVRDWIHIDDVVAGALAVVDQDVREPVNLCTGVGTSMADLVATMWFLARPDEPFPSVMADLGKPLGVMHRVGDPARMLEIYRPQITLTDGIARAIEALR